MEPRPHLQQAAHSPANLRPTLRRPRDARQYLQQRRLPRAVPPNQSQHFAFVHPQRHILQRPERLMLRTPQNRKRRPHRPRQRVPQHPPLRDRPPPVALPQPLRLYHRRHFSLVLLCKSPGPTPQLPAVPLKRGRRRSIPSAGKRTTPRPAPAPPSPPTPTWPNPAGARVRSAPSGIHQSLPPWGSAHTASATAAAPGSSDTPPAMPASKTAPRKE